MKARLLLFFLFFIFLQTQAQNKPFYNEIQYFKKQDSSSFPPKNTILFIGSSSFTHWKDVHQYFPKHQILNRGFGGSSLPHLILYAEDIIFPYHPKQIVIYCGENDFTAQGGIAPEVAVNRVKELIALIRTKYPKVPIAYISMKPSPSRVHLLAGMKEANHQIESMLKTMKKTSYINVYDAMLNTDGSIKQEIFLADNLHMNAKGYLIWQKVIEPYLKK